MIPRSERRRPLVKVYLDAKAQKLIDAEAQRQKVMDEMKAAQEARQAKAEQRKKDAALSSQLMIVTAGTRFAFARRLGMKVGWMGHWMIPQPGQAFPVQADEQKRPVVVK